MPGTPGVNGCALSCLVVNVNGMRSRNKRRGLFNGYVTSITPLWFLVCMENGCYDSQCQCGDESTQGGVNHERMLTR